MLDAFRQHLKEQRWPKVLLIVTALSMTLYLGAYFFGEGTPTGGGGGNWAAKIEGDPIPIARFQALARQIDQNYRQLLGQNYSQFRDQFQIGTQAIRQLVEREIILRDARRLGLVVSDAELIERIRSAPELADANGQFIGKQAYEQRVGRFYPGGVAAYERDLAEDLLIQKWIDLVSQAVSIDDGALEALHRERTEKTAIRYVLVPTSEQDVAEPLTDEQARSWYAEHPERYEREAGRRIAYVVVQRPQEDVQISDEDVRAAYQARQSEFSHPEQRQARHILFRLEPDATAEDKQRLRQQAEQTLERARAGEDFGALARELSEDTLSAQRGGDLGWFGRGQMVAPFEEAVFNTAPGQFAPITETQFGVHVIQVTGERPAGVRPLEEVRDEIRRDLGVQRGEERMRAEAERIRARSATPDQFESVAREEGLELQRRFVSRREGLQQIGASVEFRERVLELEPGELSQPLRLARGMAIVSVEALVPAGVAPYEEVEARVKTDLLNARAKQRALEQARRALERGKTLEAAARALGLEIRESGDVAPGQAVPASGGVSPEFRAALFGEAVQVGDTGVVEVPAGALAYEVTRREPFDRAGFAAAKAALRTELLAERRASIRSSIVDQLSRELEIQINDEAVSRIDGRS